LLAAASLAAGAISGFLAGLFGIGGSTVVIPVLYEIFRLLGVPDDVRMQLSIGTALVVTVPTTLRAYFAHNAKGAVLNDALRVWIIPAALGVLLGAYITYVAPAALFKVTFMLFAIFMSARFLLGRESWKIDDKLPGTPVMALAGALFGAVATLVGVAGGALSTLFLTLYGVSFHTAVATSTGLGVIVGLPASIGYMIAGWQHQDILPPLSIGFVSVIGVLVIAPAGVIAAPFGARLAHRLPKRKLEIAFGTFLLLVALRFAVSLIG
jgi:uncharacterized membrane protein YfcA